MPRCVATGAAMIAFLATASGVVALYAFIAWLLTRDDRQVQRRRRR